MRWSDAQKKDTAPQKGCMLVYTRKNIIFHEYEALEDVDRELVGKDLLEVHLFDDTKEYRCLSSRSRRFPSGIIETIADFPEQEHSVYKEKALLEKRFGNSKITVLNHISYNNENGMAFIDNYRLKMEEEG